jgi:hypothetical protein
MVGEEVEGNVKLKYCEVHFEDLTTKEASKKFKKFVKHWNKKKLDPIYYDHGTHYFIL